MGFVCQIVFTNPSFSWNTAAPIITKFPFPKNLIYTVNINMVLQQTKYTYKMLLINNHQYVLKNVLCVNWLIRWWRRYERSVPRATQQSNVNMRTIRSSNENTTNRSWCGWTGKCRDEIVQTFAWVQTFYVGLVKKIRQDLFPQIKVYFTSALDTVSKSSLESITPVATKQ